LRNFRKKGAKKMGGLFRKVKATFKRMSKNVDYYQQTLTFAEAGQQQAQMPAQAKTAVAEKPRKLLVIGKESLFSKEVVNYALEMAQRLSYEILALNTAPLSCETFQLFSSSRNQLCQEFEVLAKKHAAEFSEAAAQYGIPFSHVIKFSDADQALIELKKEFDDIEFVISEADDQQAVERVREGRRPKSEIFVYSVI
jgi:hypothetical protein